MRASIMVGTLSALLMLAALSSNHQQDSTWMLMHRVSIAEESTTTTRAARQFFQEAVAMELAARMDEADYLYARSVRAACTEYGVEHPITESYRRRYRTFVFRQLGGGGVLPPMVRIEPVLSGLEATSQLP